MTHSEASLCAAISPSNKYKTWAFLYIGIFNSLHKYYIYGLIQTIEHKYDGHNYIEAHNFHWHMTICTTFHLNSLEMLRFGQIWTRRKGDEKQTFFGSRHIITQV